MFNKLDTRYFLWSTVLIVIFLALASSYSLVVPLWEAPDEIGHFYFIAHLREHGTLPVQEIGALGEAHQPPLYYAIALLPTLLVDFDNRIGSFTSNPDFMWAGKGGNDINAGLHGSAETFPFQGWALAIRLARVTSILMAAVTIAFTIAIAWHIFPNRRAIGLLSAAFVAFNPQFIFISSVINNDNLLNLATMGGLWQLLRAMKKPEETPQWIYVGIWLSIGILAKLSAFVIAGLAGLILVGCAFERRSIRLFLRGAVAMLIVIGAITGWWFVRNQILYGDLLGLGMYKEVFAVNIRDNVLQLQDYRDFFSTQFRSFWGVFGWMNISAPRWYYNITGMLSLFGLIGMVTFTLRFPKSGVFESQNVKILILIWLCLWQEFYLLYVIQMCNSSCYQGRYLFPIIGPLMILLTVGLGTLLGERLRTPAISTLTLCLFLSALFMLFELIQPAYQMKALPKSALYSISNKTDYNFNSMFTLEGYELCTPSEETAITLTLYWQATQKPDFDYSAFVHLIDDSEQLVAQDDHAPGEELDFLPTRWLVGDIIVDRHIIQLPTELSPGIYRFRVGLYNWSTSEQLTVSLEDKELGSYIILEKTLKID